MATLVKLRKLTLQEREELERLARSRTQEARLVVRAKLVLGLAAGERPYQVADRVGVGRMAAYEWLHRFNAEGLVLRSLALKGRRFDSWQEVEAAVERATVYWNAHRHPFVWGRRRRHRPRRSPGVAAVPAVR